MVGHFRKHAVYGLLLLVVGSIWSLASPIGSAPDDDFHLGSIWCGPFSRHANCGDHEPNANNQRRVDVPGAMGFAQKKCVRATPIDSSCLDSAATLVSSEGRANAGLYPGGMYAFYSALVFNSPTLSALLVRISNWTLSILLIGHAIFVLPRRVRINALLVVLLVLIPQGFFFFASSNPSGPLTAVVIAYWATALRLFKGTPGSSIRSTWYSALSLIVLGALSTAFRADAIVHTVTALCSAYVVAWAHTGRPLLKPQVYFVALASLMPSVVSYFTYSQAQNAVVDGLASSQTASGQHLFENILFSPRVLLGTIGGDILGYPGWLDVIIPTFVPVLVVAGVFLIGANAKDFLFKNPFRWSALLALIVALAVTIHTLTAGSWRVGETVQSRYVLPLVVVSALVVASTSDSVSGKRLQTMVALLAATHSISLSAVLYRYTSQSASHTFWLNLNQAWWWNLPFDPMDAWLLGSFLFWLALREAVRQIEEHHGQ